MKSVVSIQHPVTPLPTLIQNISLPHFSYFQAVAALCLFAAVAADAEAKPEAEADAYYGRYGYGLAHHGYGYGLAHHGYGYGLAHHGYYGAYAHPYAAYGHYYGKRLVFVFFSF